MSNAAILSIKPVYAAQILAGTKLIELRKSSMGLSPGDVVLVYCSAPEQHLGFWFRLKRLETLPVEEMWRRYHDRIGIERTDYDTYFEAQRVAVGLHVADVHAIDPIPLRQIQQLVPGFVPPQGIIWLRDDLGKYQQLLSRLSACLPSDVFPQTSFRFDVMPARRRAAG